MNTINSNYFYKPEDMTDNELIFMRDKMYGHPDFNWNEVESNKDGTIEEQYKFELLKRRLLICPKEREKKIDEILN